MKRVLRFFKRSLATRILLVFIVTSLLITALLLTMIIKGFSTQWRTNVSPHLAQYLNYVNADIGDPPDIERAKELANELPISIYITGPELSFTSTGQALDLADLEFDNDQRRFGKRYRRANDLSDYKVQIGEHQDRTVLRSEVGDYQIYYELSHSGKRGHRDGVVTRTILSILALLGLCYLILRYMLRPGQDIKTGVNKMCAGELNYRVPVRAQNDLGDLSDSINTMADDIEKMLDAKRQLLLGVSHELRSPLTTIMASIGILESRRSELSETAQTALGLLSSDLERFNQLVADLLEISRYDTAGGRLDQDYFAIVEFVRRAAAETGHSHVQIIYPEALEETIVSADKRRLARVIANLLQNADNYAGGPTAIELRRVGQVMEIAVEDRGPGVPVEERQLIFGRFARGSEGGRRGAGTGTGLGLALVAEHVRLHSGRVRVDDRPDGEPGARFVVELPVVIDDDDE